ncbi:MAG: hypothetical protein AAGJ85_06220, partial [Pseudomonadota bacterium]
MTPQPYVPQQVPAQTATQTSGPAQPAPPPMPMPNRQPVQAAHPQVNRPQTQNYHARQGHHTHQGHPAVPQTQAAAAAPQQASAAQNNAMTAVRSVAPETNLIERFSDRVGGVRAFRGLLIASLSFLLLFAVLFLTKTLYDRAQYNIQ